MPDPEIAIQMVRDALSAVMAPELHKDLITFGDAARGANAFSHLEVPVLDFRAAGA